MMDNQNNNVGLNNSNMQNSNPEMMNNNMNGSMSNNNPQMMNNGMDGNMSNNTPQIINNGMNENMTNNTPQMVNNGTNGNMSNSNPQMINNGMNGNMPNNNPQMMNNSMNVNTTNNNNGAKKSKTGLIIGIVAIVVIVIAGIGLVATKVASSVANNDNKGNGKNSTPVSTSNKKTYGGYTFTIPDGYTATVSASAGLTISNESIEYTIGVDESMTYEETITYFMQKLGTTRQNLEGKVNGRTYGLCISTYNNLMYFTSNETSGVFYGFITKSSASSISDYNISDINDLSTILNSATEGTSNFSEGGDENNVTPISDIDVNSTTSGMFEN